MKGGGAPKVEIKVKTKETKELLDKALEALSNENWSSARRYTRDAEYALETIELNVAADLPYQRESVFSYIAMGLMILVGVAILIGRWVLQFTPIFAIAMSCLALLIGIPMNIFNFVSPLRGDGVAWGTTIMAIIIGIVIISIGKYIFDWFWIKEHWPPIRWLHTLYQDI